MTPAALPLDVLNPRVLTGRRVFLFFALFFGAIVCADAFLLFSAIRTYTGVETTSAYKAGQLYNGEIGHARAQRALGWHIESRVVRTPDGRVAIAVEAFDREGRALAGREAVASLKRPTDKRADHAGIALHEARPGRHEGSAAGVEPGQWDLVVDMLEGGERVFRRKLRIVLP